MTTTQTPVAHVSVLSDDETMAKHAAEILYGDVLSWEREGSEWFGKTTSGAQVAIVNMQS